LLYHHHSGHVEWRFRDKTVHFVSKHEHAHLQIKTRLVLNKTNPLPPSPTHMGGCRGNTSLTMMSSQSNRTKGSLRARVLVFHKLFLTLWSLIFGPCRRAM
jgi:hypothetical protein